MPLRRRLAIAIVVFGFVCAYPALSRHYRAAALLVALSSEHGKGKSSGSGDELVERELSIAGRDGPIRARMYRRADQQAGPGLVIAHGVHYRGIDERRLIPFARALARAGRVVLTPELSDLTDYRITAQGVGVISDSVVWLSAKSGAVTERQVGVLGFSFAGGLALVAASQPELNGRLSYVTSVGGHHDLGRVLKFLVSDEIETPSGIVREKAHDYGLVVLVYEYLDEFVDEEDRPVMRDALREYLHEERSLALARASFRKTESGERLFRLLDEQRLQELRPRLEELLEAKREELHELSPHGRMNSIHAPVFLLHGSGDSVIPPSETEWAEQEVGNAPHQALVSPLLQHVEVNKTAALGHQLALVDFMSKML